MNKNNTKTGSIPPQKKDYIQSKGGWTKDINSFIILQRNFLAIVVLLMFCGIIASMVVIKSMVEKNAIEPYVISVNTADKMPIAVSSQSVKKYADANSPVVEFFIVKYIKSREGYNYSTYKYDYDFLTRIMSDSQVYRQFKSSTTKDDKSNPVTMFGQYGSVEVVIKQLSHSPKDQIANIRIAKKISVNSGTRSVLNFQIKLHYKINTENLKVSDIETNPLGMTIDSYEIIEEKTIIEDETLFNDYTP